MTGTVLSLVVGEQVDARLTPPRVRFRRYTREHGSGDRIDAARRQEFRGSCCCRISMVLMTKFLPSKGAVDV